MSLTTTLKGPAAEKAYIGAPGVTGFLTGGYTLAHTIESGGRNWSMHNQEQNFVKQLNKGIVTSGKKFGHLVRELEENSEQHNTGPQIG